MAGRNPRTAPEVRSEEITAAARGLFSEKGIGRTSIKDVAERAGIARGLVYYYFPDKDALVDAVFESYAEEFAEAVRVWDAQREVGNIDKALIDCIALFRSHLQPADPLRDDLQRVENARLYNRFLDRAVRAIVDCLEVTTIEAYAGRHRIRIQNVPETFYVLIYGLVGLVRNNPDTEDRVLVSIVRQALHLGEEGREVIA